MHIRMQQYMQYLHTIFAQVEQAESAEVAVELNQLTFQLAMASNRTDENTSSYPADLMAANLLLKFSLEYVYGIKIIFIKLVNH